MESTCRRLVSDTMVNLHLHENIYDYTVFTDIPSELKTYLINISRHLPGPCRASGHSGLTGRTEPFSSRNAVQSWSQAEQMEGLVALIAEDKFLIVTWRTTVMHVNYNRNHSNAEGFFFFILIRLYKEKTYPRCQVRTHQL